MSHEHRNRALQRLGYTQREAEFLCLAALHSGYFLRRQFNAFADTAYGKSDTTLAKKLLEYGHAKAAVLRHNQTLYHLCSKPFYAALGEQDNRNRRAHFVFTIKARLMALDYVLKHRDDVFLATQSQKLAYFCDELGISRDELPFRTYQAKSAGEASVRYFVDKYPIAVTGETGSRVRFCYVDEGLHSAVGFERYLEQYRPLFSRLRAFTLVYVAAFSDLFEPARRTFAARILRQSSTPVDPLALRLLDYFRVRQAYDRRELGGFNQATVIRLREDRTAFKDAEYEDLYREWQHTGDRCLLDRFGAGHLAAAELSAEFLTYRLSFNYALFGTLANGNWRGE